jgi:hypothetical protein
MFKNIMMTMFLILMLAGVCYGRSSYGRRSTKFSVTGEVGYFLPVGDWTTHRYATGVDQFQGGYTISPELEIQFNDIGIGLLYSYTRLSAGDWENFVSSEGEDLFASGSLSLLGGLVKYYLVNTERHSFDFEGGLSYVFLAGTEKYRGFEYSYDFLESGLGFLGGVGYQYSFNKRLSFILPVRFLWKPEGIKYPEGKTYDVFGFFFLPGLKLTF